jgi:hypothetical protein
MGCGTAFASYRLFAPRFRAEPAIWRGTKAPLSNRSRVLICLWMASGALAVLVGWGSAVIIVPVLATLLLVASGSSDIKNHSAR